MKNLLFIILLSSYSVAAYSQQFSYKEYSYSEFFKMIEDSQDSVFTLEQAYIRYDSASDQSFTYQGLLNKFDREVKDTIRIQKQLYLRDVHFQSYILEEDKTYIALNHIEFKRPVEIVDTYGIIILNCIFRKEVIFRFSDRNPERLNECRKREFGSSISWINDNVFHKGLSVTSNYFIENSAFEKDFDAFASNEYYV